EAAAAIMAAKSTEELRAIELEFLGKNGKISAQMKGIGALPAEERPRFGAAVNEARSKVLALWESKQAEIESAERTKQFEAERIDVTMPGRPPRYGREHVLQLTTNKI